MNKEKAVQKYEIRFQGYLGANTSICFEDFEITHNEKGETVLRGPIRDQAELQGILTRICDLGLTLTLFRQAGEV
jgi:hypothetical protein